MATVHHTPDDMAPRRNWRTVWIILALIVAVAIVYAVASAVSQSGPSDSAIVPAEQPVTGGMANDGGIVDAKPTAETTPAPADTPLPGKAVTDGAGTGTVTDPATGPTRDGVTTGARPTDG
jgi:hypothetical protein